MATWIMFNLGKGWGHGNGEEVYVRADSIIAVTPSSEYEGESILDLSEGAGPYDVVGEPKEIIAYIMNTSGVSNSLYHFGEKNARTGA